MTPSTHRLAWLFLVLVAVLVLAPATALAGKKEDAKAHLAKAARAHKEGHYDEARAELEAAYALDPNPDVLYALGQVHAKLGNCREAAAYFKRFGATQKDPQVAKVVDEAIAACTPAAEPAPAAEPGTPSIASPRSDEPAPTAAERPGPPPIAAERPAPPPAGKPPHPEPPAHSPFAATRRAAPARAPAPVAAPQQSPWYKDKLGDGLVLGGVVAAVVGVFEYRSAVSDLDAAEDHSSAPTLARYNELVDRAHTKRTASIVLLGAGGALIAGGVVRYVLHDRTAEVRGVGVAPAPGGGVVTYAGSF